MQKALDLGGWNGVERREATGYDPFERQQVTSPSSDRGAPTF